MNKKIDLGNLYRRLYETYSATYADKKKQHIQEEVNAIWKILKSSDNIKGEVESKIKELQIQMTKKKATLLNFFSKIPSASTSRIQLEREEEGKVQGNTKEDQKPLPEDTDMEEKNILKRKISAAERQKKSRNFKNQKIVELCEKNIDLAAALKLRDTLGWPRVEEKQSGLLEVIKDLAVFGGAADDRRRTEIIRCCKTLDDLQAELCKLGYTISRSGLYLRLLPRRVNTEEGKRHVVTVPVKLCKPDSALHFKHQDGTFCTAMIRHLESLASILGPEQVFFLSMDDKARVPLGITAAKAQAPILMHLDYRVKLPDHDFVVAEKHKLIPSVYAGIVVKKDGEGKPEAVSHSGSTYVAIRSGKHSSSNAETHATDIDKLSEISAFENFMKTREGFVKPVFIFTCDGGPDENPRYERVIISAIQHFKDFDLDAVYIATNAPGRSAFNRVERRMAPLSRELTGVVLKHDNFGSHLDSSNKTTDLDLEKRNFESAGTVLSNIWSQLVIDGYPVVAKYIMPTETRLDVEQAKVLKRDVIWYANHVRESQYLLQIVKCEVVSCCGVQRSSLRRLLREGFLPPPVLIKQTSNGYITTEKDDIEGKFAPLLLQLSLKLSALSHLKQVPYDSYCPSVEGYLCKRSCGFCGLYFASYKATNQHKQLHKEQHEVPIAKIRPQRIAARRAREILCLDINDDAIWLDEKDVDTTNVPDVENLNENEVTAMPVINNLKEWVQSPWTEDD
ncbi:hypothetical protein EVAR_885_1 [Eumeta japonica]|uniref:C2H2-type domain-containing protein n=1 Tax=Eumeta variegata TaxID=151549 RepID=A0A4C1SDY1_EUMVA|nr:hypothetical protein EVAR_885_1 [Eumeta japonica]